MSKIVDTFLFFNELEMLDFHLHEMNDIVDYFIIGESEETFSGKAKPMLYLENASRYEQFAHKIIHIPIKAQTNDILIVSDVDEIADHNTLRKISKIPLDLVYTLEQDTYYYNINSRLAERQCCTNLCSVSYARNHSLQEIRFRTRAAILRPGGWHFSYFGSAKSIVTKIENFSHQDLNKPQIKNLDRIETVINNGADLYGREQNKPEKYQINHISINENNYLPKHYKMLIGSQNWQLQDPTK